MTLIATQWAKSASRLQLSKSVSASQRSSEAFGRLRAQVRPGRWQITPASTNERLTAKGYKYFFRMPPRDDVQAWSTVQFLENKLKAKTLALIDDKQTYTAGLTANITKYAKENDKVKIVAHEHITPGDSDFTAVLTKLKRINPDVIYMGVYQPEGSKMIQQVRKLGLESTFMSEDAVYHPKFLEVGGPSAEGVYLTFAKAPETPEREQFIKTYKAMWKADAVGSYAGAMGRPQFMPSSYRAYAVDSTGDGKRDIWNDWKDVAGSIANYFNAHGWRTGEEVTTPATISGRWSGPFPENTLKAEETVGSLSEMGVMFSTTKGSEAAAQLLTLEVSDGNEHWVGFHNFFVITRYNRSVMYALAVHQLGQEIAAKVSRDAE